MGALGYLGNGSAPECFSGFEAETVCFCKTSCFNAVFFCNPQYLSYTSFDAGQLNVFRLCMQYFGPGCNDYRPPRQSNVFTVITVPVHTERLGTCMPPQQQSDARSAQQPLPDQIIKYTDLDTCLTTYYSSPSSFCGCDPKDGVHPGRVTTAITRPPPILMIHLARFEFQGSAAGLQGGAAKLTQKVQPLQLTFYLWHIARPVHHSVAVRHLMSHCVVYDLPYSLLLLNLQMLVVTGTIQHTPLLQIEYPEKLDMGQYMIDGLLDMTYVLRGILVHEGETTASGHHYTYAFRDGEWWCYDDAECCVVCSTSFSLLPTLSCIVWSCNPWSCMHIQQPLSRSTTGKTSTDTLSHESIVVLFMSA